MKVSIFPETWGDVILHLIPTGINGHDASGASLCVVDKDGDVKDFGVIAEIKGTPGPGGHAEMGRPICAANLGFERENERVECPEV